MLTQPGMRWMTNPQASSEASKLLVPVGCPQRHTPIWAFLGSALAAIPIRDRPTATATQTGPAGDVGSPTGHKGPGCGVHRDGTVLPRMPASVGPRLANHQPTVGPRLAHG